MSKKWRRYEEWANSCIGDGPLVSGAVEFCIAFREYRSLVEANNKSPTFAGLQKIKVAQAAMDEAWLLFERRMKKITKVVIGPPEEQPKSLFGGE